MLALPTFAVSILEFGDQCLQIFKPVRNVRRASFPHVYRCLISTVHSHSNKTLKHILKDINKTNEPLRNAFYFPPFPGWSVLEMFSHKGRIRVRFRRCFSRCIKRNVNFFKNSFCLISKYRTCSTRFNHNAHFMVC